MSKSLFIKVSILSLLLAVLFTLPAIFHLGSLFIGDGYDNYQQAGYQALFATLVNSGQYPFSHTDLWRYPVGFDFARGFDSYLGVAGGGLLTLVVGMPLAYNLTLLILLALNGLASFAFFRKLTQSSWLGAIGMLCYGFSFYVLARADAHLNLVFIAAVPLAGLSLLTLKEATTLGKKDFGLFGITIAALLVGSLQYLLMIAFGVIWLGFVLLIFYRKQYASLKQLLNNNKQGLFWLSTAGLIAFIVLYGAQLSALFSGSFIFFSRSEVLSHATPSLTDFLFPNGYLSFLLFHLGKSTSDASVEKVVFFGWLEILLFVSFFFTGYTKRLKIFLLSLGLLPFILSLGYGQANHAPFLPYRFLEYVFPFKGIAETGRYFILTSFVMTTAVVLGLKRHFTRYSFSTICLVIVGILILERIPSHFLLAPSLKDQNYIAVVKKLPGKAVLDLPVNPYYAPYDMLSYYYDKPIVNGYFHWSSDGIPEQSFIGTNSPLGLYTCSIIDPILSSTAEQESQTGINYQIISLLRENNINTIVVHKDDKFYHPVCKNVRERLSGLLPAITEVKATSPQQQIQGTLIDGRPHFSIYIPTSGTLSLDGLYVAPSNQASFTITLADKLLPSDTTWENGTDTYSLQLSIKKPLTLKVTAGTMLTVSSKDWVSTTVYSIWYHYTPDSNQETIPLRTPLQKEYEDATAAVYSLH